MTLAERGQAMLIRRMKQAAGVAVTYTRGGQSVAVTAWVGRTLFAANNAGGPRVEWGDRDYLLAVADLVLGGTPTEPQEGDRLAETIGGVEHTFEVMTPDTGEPAWRYSDPGRTVYRLHAKRVA